MKIEDLFLFVQVADHLSFTKAGNLLDLPQSTVSRKIKQMEDALAIRLFERTSHEIFLTEPGRQFYEHSKKIVAEYEDAKSYLLDYSTEPRGDVTLYCAPYFAKQLAVDFFSVFMKNFPKIHLIVRSFEPLNMGKIQEGDLIFYLYPPKDPTMIARRIFTVSRRFYASPEYLADKGLPTHPRALSEHNCVRFDNRIFPVEQWSYVENNEEKKIRVGGSFTCDAIDTTLDMAIKGLGVCWVPQPMANKSVREGKLVCLFDGGYGTEQPYYVIYHSKNYVPKKVKVFLDMLTQYMDQHQNIFNENLNAFS